MKATIDMDFEDVLSCQEETMEILRVWIISSSGHDQTVLHTNSYFFFYNLEEKLIMHSVNVCEVGLKAARFGHSSSKPWVEIQIKDMPH